MPDREDEPRPATSDKGRARAADREARLAAALRANLGRRKAQARDRAEEDNKPGKSEPTEG